MSRDKKREDVTHEMLRRKYKKSDSPTRNVQHRIKIHLSVSFDHGFAMSRVDFVPAVGAESDPLSKKQK